MLKISNLNIWVGNKELVKDINLTLKIGETHALMGPNGSGKTSLALGMMGHPSYPIKKGRITIGSKDITNLNPEKKAKFGLFLSFQTPPVVSGVSLARYLKEAKKSLGQVNKFDIAKFYKDLVNDAKSLGLNENFLERPLNEAFSGGERKKVEMLSLLVLKPKYIILDEIDTGLDMDTLKMVVKIINKLKKTSSILIITHYKKILDYIKPDYVHILKKGKISVTGKFKLLEVLERGGYAAFN